MGKDNRKISYEDLEKKCENLQETIVNQVLESIEQEGRIYDLENRDIKISKVIKIEYEPPTAKDTEKLKILLQQVCRKHFIEEGKRRGIIPKNFIHELDLE